MIQDKKHIFTKGNGLPCLRQYLRVLMVMVGLFMGLSATAWAQTQGLIYKPATGNSSSILDPNGDGYVSQGGSGFQYNDVSESEISYVPLYQKTAEATNDVRTGPKSGHTDLVGQYGDGKKTAFMYYDQANNALLFRIRLAGQSKASKGYSFLFNTDFDQYGPQADNFTRNNPGFQYEVVLESNFRVAIYQLDGDTETLVKEFTNIDDYFQKAISYNYYGGSSGDYGYFYDFYVPLDQAPSDFVTAISSDFRVTVSTITNAKKGITGVLSDVLGSGSLEVQSQCGGLNALTGSGFGCTEVDPQTLTPTIDKPLYDGDTSVSGHLSEPDGSTVYVYKNGSQIGTATVSNFDWELTGISLATDDQVKARATTTGKKVSDYSSSITVGAAGSFVPCSNGTTAKPTITGYDSPGGSGHLKTVSGKAEVGATVTLYDLSYNVLGSGTANSSGNWTVSSNTKDPGEILINAQSGSKCASEYVTLDNSYNEITNYTSAPSILSSPKVGDTSVEVKNLDASSATIYLYVNEQQVAVSNNAVPSNGTTTFTGLSTFSEDDVIAARAKNSSDALSDRVYKVATKVAQSEAPEIVGDYIAGSNVTIEGFSTEEAGSEIKLYINGTQVSSTEVLIDNTWQVSGVDISDRDVLTATATAPGETESDPSPGVTVLAGTSRVPTVDNNLTIYSTEITGSSSAGGTLKIYVDDGIIGKKDLSSGGSWTFTDTDAGQGSGYLQNELYQGATVTATLTEDGKPESDQSSGVEVTGITSFSIEASGGGDIGTQVAGTPFDVDIAAREGANGSGNVFTQFSDHVLLYSVEAPVTDGHRITNDFSSGQITHSTQFDDGAEDVQLRALYTNNPEITGISNKFLVNNPQAVTLTSVSPTFKYKGEAEFELVVNGTNFVSSSVVRFNSSDRPTTFVSSTKLKATIKASDLSSLGNNDITVYSPPPQGTGDETDPVNFEVREPPQATITSISPDNGNQFNTFDVTITGTNLIGNGVTTVDLGNNITINSTSSNADYTELTANITINDATTGPRDVTVNNPSPNNTPSTLTDGFTVNASGFSQFIITNISSPQTAGAPFQITISAADADGTTTGFTGKADLSISDGDIDPTTTGDFSSGTWTGNVTVTKAADNLTITAVNAASTGNQSGTSNQFNVTAGSAAQYLVTVSNSSPKAGDAITVTAQLADQYGNAVSTQGNMVSWSSTNGGSFGSATSTTNASGVATVTFTTSSTEGTDHKISATDGDGNTGQSSTITTTVAPPTQIAFTSSEKTITAGNASSLIVIELQDDAGNAQAATSSTTITLSTDSGTGVFRNQDNTGDLTNNEITIPAGVSSVSFRYQDETAGTYTLQAANGSLTDSQNITVTAGSADHFLLSASPSSITAGGSTNLTITTKDVYGNTATGYTGDKTLTFSGANAAPDGTSPSVKQKDGTSIDLGSSTTINFSSGAASVSSGSNGVLTLYKAETANIGVTDGSISEGSTLDITVGFGSLDQFAWNLNSPQINRQPFTGTNTLTALDNYGNTVTDFDASSDKVTITNTIGGTVTGLGSGSDNVLDQSGDFASGVANLTDLGMTYRGTAGSGTFTATSGTGKTGESSSVTINAGSPSQLVYSNGPTNTTAGATISDVVLEVQDADGNTVTADPDGGTTEKISVSLTDNTEGATLSGNQTADINWTNGTATFGDLSVDKVGSYQLQASTTINGISSVNSSSFNITAGSGVASNSTATVPNGMAGQATNITITVKDGEGNLVTGEASNLGISVSSGPNKDATFTAITDEGDGTYTTSYTPTATGDDDITIKLSSTEISGSPYTSTVSAGAPTAVVFTSSAQTITAGVNSSNITVELRDANGNTATAGAGGITFDLSTDGSGEFRNTGNETAITSITISDGASTGSFRYYSETAATDQLTVTDQNTSTGVGSANQNITVNPGPISVASSGTELSGTNLSRKADGTEAATINLQLKDEIGNDIAQQDVDVTFATTGGTLSATDVVTDASGQASVTLTSTNAGNFDVTAKLDDNNDNTADADVTRGSPVQVTFEAGTAANLVINNGNNQSGTVETTLANGLEVKVTDTNDNPVNGVSVDFAIATTPASATGQVLSTSSATTNANGVASVDLTLGDLTGTYQVEASVSSPSLGPVTFDETATAGIPNKLVFTSQPTSTISGQTLNNVVAEVQDANGNTVTTDPNGAATEKVGLAFTSNTNTEGATLSGTTSVNIDWATGTATFSDLSIDKVGSYQLDASDVNFSTDLSDITSNSFSITTGSADAGQSEIAASPKTITTDESSTITVTLKDAAGNPLTTGGDDVYLEPSQGSLSSVTNEGDGTYTAIFTSTATGSATITGYLGTSNSDPQIGTVTVTVNPGTISASNSTVTATSPVTADGSSASTVTIILKDVNGNVISGKASNISLSGLSDANAGTVREPTAGTYEVDVIDATAEAVTVTVTADGTTLDDTPSITFKAGAVASFTVSNPDPINQGEALQVDITGLKDSEGNTAADGDYDITVGNQLTGSEFMLTGVAFTNGNASGVQVLDGSATTSLTAQTYQDVSFAIEDGTDNADVTVQQTIDDGSGVTLTASDVSINQGDPLSVTITDINDLAGNPFSGTTDIVISSLNNLDGYSSGNKTFSGASISNGEVTLEVLNGTETSSLSVQDNVALSASIGQASGDFNVTVQGVISASNSSVTVDPASVLANGVSYATATIAAKDVSGNPVSGLQESDFDLNFETGTTSNENFGSFNKTGDGSDPANGIYTFRVTDASVETGNVQATVNGQLLDDQPQVAFTQPVVSAGNSSITANPTEVEANGTDATTLTLTVADADGVGIDGYTVDDFTFTGLSDAQVDDGSFAATGTRGEYTVNVTNTTAEKITVGAKVDGETIGSTNEISFTPGPAASIVLTGSTDDLPSGSDRTLTATLYDAQNNVVTSGSDSDLDVAFTKSSGTGSVSGLSTVTASNGVATLDITGQAAGALTIQAEVTTTASTTLRDDLSFTVTTGLGAPTITTPGDGEYVNADEAPAVTVSGTAAGASTARITITDKNSNKVEKNVTVSSGDYTHDFDVSGLDDGDLTISVVGIDDASNESSATSIDVTLDQVTPTFSVNDQLTNDDTPTITGTSDQPTGSTISITINGNTYTGTTDAKGDWSIDVTDGLTDGEYTASATTADEAGNETTSTGTITVDTTPPVLTINGQTTNDGTPDITGTSNEPSGSEVSVTINGNTYTGTVDGDGNWSVTVTDGLPDGDYTAEATITDKAGNTTIKQSTITVDTTAPTLAIQNAPDIVNSTDAFELTFEFSENVSGFVLGDISVTNGSASNFAAVDGNTYTADITPDGTGDIAIDVAAGVATDDAGNGNTAASQESITYDATVPTLTVNDLQTNDNTPSIKGTSDETGGTVTLTIEGTDYTTTVGVDESWTVDITSELADDIYTASAELTDGAGNTVNATGTITIDTQAPTSYTVSWVTDPINLANETNATFSITNGEDGANFDWTISDGTNQLSGSGTFDGTTATVSNQDVSGLADGTLTASVTLTDAVGNQGSQVTADVQKDTKAPRLTQITRQTPSDELTNADALTFRAEFSENVTGLSTDDFVVSGATGTALAINAVDGATYDITIDGGDLSGYNGTVRLALVDNPSVKDGAENSLTNTSATGTVETYTLDNTAPQITDISLVGSPANDASSIQYQVTLSENVTNFDLNGFSLTTTGDASGTIASYTGSDDTYTVTVNALDGVGSVRLDFTASISNAKDMVGNAIEGDVQGATHTVDVVGDIDLANSSVSASPTTLAAGQKSTITMTLRDGNDNPITTFTESDFTVDLGTSDAEVVANSFSNESSGVYKVQVTDETAENVTATITVDENGTDTEVGSAGITFTAADAATIVLSANPSDPAAGSNTTLTATVTDQYGNLVSGEDIDFSIQSGNGAFDGANTNIATNANGEATVTYTTDTSVETAQLHAQLSDDGTITDDLSLTSVPGAAAQYLITESSTSVTAGENVTVTAQLADVNGNHIAEQNRTVNWSATNGGSFSDGGSTQTDTNGKTTVTFTTSTTAGTDHVVTATDNGDGSITGTSQTITTQVGSASQLTFAGQPNASTPAGDNIGTITVRLEDASGNLIETDGTSIVLAISDGATLVGRKTQSTTNGVATFDNLYVEEPGTGYMLTATSGSLDSDQSNTFDITRRAITITADAQSKTYGDADPSLDYTVTSGSLISGVSLNGSLSRAAGEEVGTYGITQNDITNTNNPSYDITYVSDNLTIAKKDLTLSNFAASDKEYDGNKTASGITFDDDRINSDDLSFSYDAAFGDAAAGTGKAVTVTNITIDGGTDAGNYNLVTTSGSATADITKKSLTVSGATAVDKTYDGSTNATITGATLQGKVGTDDVSLDALVGNFNSSDIGTGIKVNAALTLDGTDADNYTLTQPIGLKADITAKSLTIGGTFTAKDKSYDGDASATIDQNNLTLPDKVSGDIVTLNPVAAFADATVGTGKAVTLTGASTISGSDASNYTLSMTDAPATTADITKASPNVTAWPTASSITYGQALSVSTLGGGTADQPGTFDFSDDTIKPDAGTYSATVTFTPTDGNYSSVDHQVDVTVNPKGLTVSGATASDKTYDGNTDASISGATLSGVLSGDDVSLTNAASGTFDQATVGTGILINTSMSLSGSDTGNYTLSQPSLTADITAKELTVSGAAAQNKTYDGTTNATISGASLVGVVSGDNVSLQNATTGTFDQADTGNNINVTTSMSLGDTDAGNYNLTNPTGLSANITSKQLTLTGSFSADNKSYDGNASAAIISNSLSLSGIVNTESVSLTAVAEFQDAEVGTGKTVSLTSSSLSGADAGNYSLSFAGAPSTTADIIAKQLTIGGDFTANDKTYDGSTSATIATNNLSLSGIVGTENVKLNPVAEFSDASVGTNKTVSLTGSTNISGTDASNYTLSLSGAPTTTADITDATVTVSAWPTATDIEYGEALNNSTLTGGTADQSGSFAFTNPTTKPASAGTYSASVTFTPDNGNYSSVTQQVDVAVNPKELTVSGATASDKEYDGTNDATLTGATLNGIIHSDDVSLDALAGSFASADVGTGIEITAALTLTGGDTDNYSLTQPTGLSADITAKELTIGGSFTALDKSYDGNTSATIDQNNLTLPDKVSGDAVTLNPVAGFGNASVGTGKTVSLTGATSLSGTDASNYTLSMNGAPTTTADITAGAASQMTVSTQPSTTTAGESIAGPPAVKVTDNGDNPVSGVDVTVAINKSSFKSGTVTQTTDANGVATFGDLVLSTADTGYQLTFNADASGVTNKTSNAFEVVLGPAASIALTGTTSDLTSGSDRALTATLYDSENNVVTSGGDSGLDVAFTKSSGAGSVSGLKTIAATNGVVTLDVTGHMAGALTIQAEVTTTASTTLRDDLSFTVATGLGTPTIATPGDGDYVNADEAPAVTVSGMAPGASTARITITDKNSNKVEKNVTVSSGDYTHDFDVSGLDDGDLTISVVGIDDASNESLTTAIDVTLDQVAPTLSVNDQLTNDDTPTLTGTSDQPAGSTVSITINGNTYTGTTDSNGDWSIDVTDGLTDGEYTASATTSDKAGNETTATGTITVDTTPPALTIDNQTTNDATPVITGTSDEPSGSSVSVTINSNTYTGTVDGNGNWSVTVTDELPEADYTAGASITDKAGNTTTKQGSITIDTTAPAITINDQLTTDNTPTITGTSDEIGATVTVSIDGADYTGTVAGDGSWSIDVTNTLADNAYTATASVTDDAGTKSTDTATITVDTTAPAGYMVAWDTDPINSSNQQAAGFTLTGGEDGADYAWTITDGTADITGSGTMNGTSLQVQNRDVSALADGTLTVSVRLTDEAGNQGAKVSDDVSKNTVAAAISAVSLGDDGSDNLTFSFNTDVQLGSANGDVAVSVDGPNTQPVYNFDRSDFTETGNGDGTWTYSLSTTQAYDDGDGTYTATINDAKDVAGNDGADGTDKDTYMRSTVPANLTITGGNSQVDTVAATLDKSLQVKVTNPDGNPVSGVTIDFTISTTPNGASGQRLSAGSATTNDSGFVSVDLTLGNRAGTYEVTASSGSLTAVQFTETANPGKAVAATSLITAVDQSITADGSSATTITVQLKDQHGNNVNTGGENIALTTTAGTLSSVTDQNDGTYTAGLTSSTKVETANITGTLNSAAITDDENVNFTVGTYELTKSTISVDKDTITADGSDISNVTVQLKDANSNNITTGGETVVIATDFGKLSATKDENDGTYTATLSATDIGTATLSATVNGDAITSGNPKVAIVSGAAAKMVINSGNNQSKTAATDLDNPLEVLVTDANDNPVSGATVNFTVSNEPTDASGSALSSSSATTDVNGLASVNLTLGDRVGAYEVRASSGNLTDVTFTATATAGNADLAKSTITADPTTLTADGSSTSSITVRLKDTYDNDLTSSAGTVTLSTDVGTVSSVTDNRDGTYTATYTSATTTGKATITGKLDGSDLADDTSVALTSGAASLATSTITAADDAITADGQSTTTITVQLKDVNGNNITTGGETVSLATDAGSLGSVTDNSDGTYTAILTSTVSLDTATVTGLLNGKDIEDDALVNFVAGQAAELVIVSGDGQSAPVGKSLNDSLRIKVTDANDNPVRGETVNFALSSTPSGATGTQLSAASKTTARDGTASVALTLGDLVGTYTVEASSGSLTPVKFTASAVAGLVDTITKVSGDHQKQATLSVLKDSLVVQLKDEFGNPVPDYPVVYTISDQPENAKQARLNPKVQKTDANGYAYSKFKLGDISGSYTVAATAKNHPDSVFFAETGKESRPNPTIIDTVNTVVFNGDEDSFMYAKPSKSLDNLQDMTVEIWMLPKTLGNSYTIMEKMSDSDASQNQFRISGEQNTVHVDLFTDSGETVSMQADSFFVEKLQNSQARVPATIASSAANQPKYKWTHLAVSVDVANGTAKFYRNGFQVDQATIKGKLNTGKKRLMMGSGFDGEVHEVRIWDESRTRNQLQSNMTRLLDGNENHLVLYHTFDEKNKSTDHDLTNEGNDLFLSANVERNFSIRGIPNIEMLEDDDYIMAFKGVDENGSDLDAVINKLPEHGTLYQVENDGTTIGNKITSVPTTLSDADNRAYYKPDQYFNGSDKLDYSLKDVLGNTASATRKITIYPVNNAPTVDFADHDHVTFDQRDTLRVNLGKFVKDVDNSFNELSWKTTVLSQTESRGVSKGQKIATDFTLDASRHAKKTAGDTHENEPKEGAYRYNIQYNRQGGSRTLNANARMSEVATVVQTNSETSQKDSLIITIDRQKQEVVFTTTPAFYAPDIPVYFEAHDLGQKVGGDTLSVTVNHVNGPPQPFAQLKPAKNDTVKFSDIKTSMQFSWQNTTDIEQDSIEYIFELTREDGTTKRISGVSDTTLVIGREDPIIEMNKKYRWRVWATDKADTTASLKEERFIAAKDIPLYYKLSQNYPNPFNPTTKIEYWVPIDSKVEIRLYNIIGQQIAVLVEGQVSRGLHAFDLNASDYHLASGIYFYRMAAEGLNRNVRFVKTRKFTLIK